MREVKPHSFIYEIPNALPGGVCREIVRRFEEKTDQQNAGRIGCGQTEESSIKKTTDIFISGREGWKDIDAYLRQSLLAGLREVVKLYPFFAVNRGRVHDTPARGAVVPE